MRRFLSSVLTGVVVAGAVAVAPAVPAFADVTVSLGSGTSSLVVTPSVATNVNTVLGNPSAAQVSGYGASDTVKVIVSATSGSVSLVTTTGLSLATGYSSYTGAAIGFQGSQTNVNNALASMTFTSAGNQGATISYSSSIVLSATQKYWDPNSGGNGHYYEFVDINTDWTTARAGALAKSFAGKSGYLANISSASEQTYVQGTVLTYNRLVWMGGSDAAVEGEWRWMDGPEAGTQFWSGGAGGTVVNSSYANWKSGNPDNAGNEDYACFDNYSPYNGQWCDYNGTATYVVEYSDTGGASIGPLTASRDLTVTTVPGAPTGVSAVPGNGQARVSWSAPDSTGGSAVTAYTVTASGGGATCSPSPVSTSCVVTGLTNGTAYTFTVTATNGAGTGSASSASSSVTPRAAPAAPTGGSVSSGTYSWNAESSVWSSGTDRIYVVYKRTADVSNSSIKWAVFGYNSNASAGSATATSLELAAGASPTTCSAANTTAGWSGCNTPHGLDTGTSYTFRVFARASSGTLGYLSAPVTYVAPA